MWLSSKVVDWFHISRDTIATMREEVAALRVERDTLKFQLQVSQNQFQWVCAQINALQVERAELVGKVMGIRIPAVPEISMTTPLNKTLPKFGEIGFQHIDEDTAKQLGIEHLLS